MLPNGNKLQMKRKSEQATEHRSFTAADVLMGRVTAGDVLSQLAARDFGRGPSPDASQQILAIEHLGRLVREARQGRKLSQQDFADLAGVGRRFLSELENGKPTLEFGKVLKAAAAAGIDLFAKKRG